MTGDDFVCSAIGISHAVRRVQRYAADAVVDAEMLGGQAYGLFRSVLAPIC
ncbi:hypothetical protein [Bifidobacterium leontopitheci]|uniref:hypothetical protein n=1 Tax=Bifidobacterium leontopitheci TaxID=2650774 RepID=UPI00186B14D7|nr:hypothetical protein [Bifidobacterium leontopitheci]